MYDAKYIFNSALQKLQEVHASCTLAVAKECNYGWVQKKVTALMISERFNLLVIHGNRINSMYEDKFRKTFNA